jgi:hypothetical protein
VTAISAVVYHTCAVKDGGAWWWGMKNSGQLGDNGTTESDVPVAVGGLSSGVDHRRQEHTCALNEGGAWCWAGNDYGHFETTARRTAASRSRSWASPAAKVWGDLRCDGAVDSTDWCSAVCRRHGPISQTTVPAIGDSVMFGFSHTSGASGLRRRGRFRER